MKAFPYFAENEGFTLIESIVALALFLSVVIPLVSSLGGFMATSSVDRIRTALREAESAIMSAQAVQDSLGEIRKIELGMTLKKSVERSGRLTRISVMVYQNPSKAPIVSLERTFLHAK